jgi:hypothetical protein
MLRVGTRTRVKRWWKGRWRNAVDAVVEGWYTVKDEVERIRKKMP